MLRGQKAGFASARPISCLRSANEGDLQVGAEICYNRSMNVDLERGHLFGYRALELLWYLQKQSRPYYGTETDLAKAMGIGPRTIRRYLRYLQSLKKIQLQHSHHKITNGTWCNSRKIVVLEG